MVERGSERVLRIPGHMNAELAAGIEEAIWDRMHFASHLRSQRLGEFTVGTELQRSESLAIVQLLILYHVATAKAMIAMGGPGPRAVDRLNGVPARASNGAVAVADRAAAAAG